MINEDDLWASLEMFYENGTLIGLMSKEIPEEMEGKKKVLDFYQIKFNFTDENRQRLMKKP